MLRLVVFAVVVVAANCALLFGQWENFKLRHGKEYTDNENAKRRAIYEENMKYIQKHNAEQHSYKLGENEYADWTNEEFRKYMNGWRQTSKRRPAPMHEPQMGDLPEEVNWKDEGYVTGVKNQKQCGSCWSFSATGALEGQNFKMNRKLISLSEQNLIDCSRAEGNMGCEGGLMDLAFAYVQMNDGIDTEESYPYTAMDGPMCKYTLENKAATDVGYRDIKSMDEMALKEAVANVGPISVAIDASKKSFQLYSSGVYRDDTCSQTVLDHGVLAVGYGTDDMSGMDYWLVKNSWGMSWGMEGYIKMARNRDNMCGIATNASYPIVP